MGVSEKIQSFQAVNAAFGLAQGGFASGRVEPRPRLGYRLEYIKGFSGQANSLVIQSNRLFQQNGSELQHS